MWVCDVDGGCAIRRRCSPPARASAGGVECSVVHRQQVAAGLFDTPRDAVSVQGSQGLQRLQFHQGQRALPDVLFLAHRLPSEAPMGCPYHICHRPYGNAIEETQDRDILFPVFFHFFSKLARAAGSSLPVSLTPPSSSLTLRKLPTSLMRLVLQLLCQHFREESCMRSNLILRCASAVCLTMLLILG